MSVPSIDAWARGLDRVELSKQYLACDDVERLAALEREVERRPLQRPSQGWWFERAALTSPKDVKGAEA